MNKRSRVISTLVGFSILAGSGWIATGVQAEQQNYQKVQQIYSGEQSNYLGEEYYIDSNQTIYTPSINTHSNHMFVVYHCNCVGEGTLDVHFQLQERVKGQWVEVGGEIIFDEGQGAMGDGFYDNIHPGHQYRYEIMNRSNTQVRASIERR